MNHIALHLLGIKPIIRPEFMLSRKETVFPKKVCKTCDKTFQPENNRQIYCTSACYEKSRLRGGGKNIARSKLGKCGLCETNYLKTNYNQSYCSADCCRKAKSKREYARSKAKKLLTKGEVK